MFSHSLFYILLHTCITLGFSEELRQFEFILQTALGLQGFCGKVNGLNYNICNMQGTIQNTEYCQQAGAELCQAQHQLVARQLML